ncbi:MAG: energy transducer TonB [Syntrophobacteraceae bacterium]
MHQREWSVDMRAMALLDAPAEPLPDFWGEESDAIAPVVECMDWDCPEEDAPLEGEGLPWGLRRRSTGGVVGLALSAAVHVAVIAFAVASPFAGARPDPPPFAVMVNLVSLPGEGIKEGDGIETGVSLKDGGGGGGGQPESPAAPPPAPAPSEATAAAEIAPPPESVIEHVSESDPPAPVPVVKPKAKERIKPKPKETKPEETKTSSVARKPGRRPPPAAAPSRPSDSGPNPDARPEGSSPASSEIAALHGPDAGGGGPGWGAAAGSGGPPAVGLGGSGASAGMKGGSGEGMEIRQVDQPPVVIQRAEPDYPPDARRMHIGGRVVVRFLVKVDGSVTKASIVEATPEGVFERSALAAVNKWRFKPGRFKGSDVATWVLLPVEYRMAR